MKQKLVFTFALCVAVAYAVIGMTTVALVGFLVYRAIRG